jgi:hypothetical protein
MHKAYDCGARTVWVLNVGGLKKSAIDMEFFLRMAWDINSWSANAQSVFLTDWARRNFGQQHAAGIAAVLGEYFQLNYPAKPEHLLQAQFTDNYNEKVNRLRRFASLVDKTNALYGAMPLEKKEGFYECVVYPVRCSALLNQKWLSPDAAQAATAYEQIQAETKYFNEQLAGGKWANMMSSNPRDQPVFRNPAASPSPQSAGIQALPASANDAQAVISLPAARGTRHSAGEGSAWTVIPGLGRSGESITLLPPVAAPAAGELDYNFEAPKAGPANIVVYCIPTHAIYPGLQLRYSAAIDDQPPQIVDLDTVEFSKPWGINVLRGAAVGTTPCTVGAGKHRLKIRPLDPGVVFDKIVIDLGGLKPSQLGPPETAMATSSGDIR